MLLAVDVQYEANKAFVAGVSFENWEDEKAGQVFKTVVEEPGEYQPGEFYRRELPCILALLDKFKLAPQTIVVDGFVYLDGTSQPGLGKHLYEALHGTASVIGVAKSAYQGISDQFALLHGGSLRPLYVTCVGMELAEAMGHIQAMHGKFRMPTLLKLVDTVCREKQP